MLNIRPAITDNADMMADVINHWIISGETTAHRTPFTSQKMVDHYIKRPSLISCHVAEWNGTIIGFQTLAWANDPNNPMPDGWASIASFVAHGQSGKGTGHSLFEVTKRASKNAGVVAIDATIRADNLYGLGYYSKLGFEDYDRSINVTLSDGLCIDLIHKRLFL